VKSVAEINCKEHKCARFLTETTFQFSCNCGKSYWSRPLKHDFRSLPIGTPFNALECNAETCTWASEGKGGELVHPGILKFSAKKAFLVSSGKNQIAPLLAPLEKILPTPMNLHRGWAR